MSTRGLGTFLFALATIAACSSDPVDTTPDGTNPDTPVDGTQDTTVPPVVIDYETGLDPALYRLENAEDAVRIMIKFEDGTAVRLQGREFVTTTRTDRDLDALDDAELTPQQVEDDLDRVDAALFNHLNTLDVYETFSIDTSILQSLRTEAELAVDADLPDPTLFFSVDLTNGSTAGDVRGLLDTLNRLPTVSLAYTEGITEGAIDIAPPTPDFEGGQGYLDSAPGGVDAYYAWTVAGGNGSSRDIVDLEWGWRTSHEDFPSFFRTDGAITTDLASRNHGTAVVGEMVAQDNGYGVTGITPAARIGYTSFTTYNSADAILNTAMALDPGDVMLLEIHRLGPANATDCTCNLDQCDYIPVEYWYADYIAIAIATHWLGVNVVEAGGNGSSNLDDPVYGGLFDRATRDSGAIMVGASTSAAHVPTCWSNYGSRIDVHAWGENIVTTGYGDPFAPLNDEDQFYTSTFGGTSGASPMVTAAVASLQSVSDHYGKGTLHPLTMRELVRSTGTLQEASPLHIGPMPDLRDAIGQLLGYPDLWGAHFTPNGGLVKINPFTGQFKPASYVVDFYFFQLEFPITFPYGGVTTAAYKANEASLYVATGDGNDGLYRINTLVGGHQYMGHLGMATDVQSMDFAPPAAAAHGFTPGALYAISLDAMGECKPNCFYQLHPGVGGATQLSTLQLNQGRGLSFHPITGELWVLDSGGKRLYTLGADGTLTYQSTIQTSYVDQRIGLDTGFSLAHGHDGEMYIVDNAYGVLLQVDPYTGYARWEGPFGSLVSNGSRSITGLDGNF